MNLSTKRLLGIGLAASFLILSACTDSEKKADIVASEPTVVANNDDYYEVHHEGRIYAFDDADTYLSFLEVGETAYRKVRIGAGPHGETVVFGLTGEDKKKQEGIAAIDLYDGKLAPAANFYAELHSEGRIYVFDDWDELQTVKQVGEAAYRYTMIGMGPQGETVVFVQTKDNKKVKPEANIARFKALHRL